MNRRHLLAIIALRWRLAQNRLARAGQFGQILAIAISIVAFLMAASALLAPLTFGARFLPGIDPDVLMLIWDGMIFAFILFWVIGLLTELQRADALSLDRLLHLPVSPRGAFLLNYLGSFANASMLIWGSAMLGFCIAQLATMGPAMLLMFPLALSFLVMISALTYQFRGWLASLMMNKRRRGTVIALVTLTLVAVGQLPNLIHLAVRNRDDAPRARHEAALAEVDAQGQAGELTGGEVERHKERLTDQYERQEELREDAENARMRETLVLANSVLPIGWLPYGARGIARGDVLPALLGTAGALAIGWLSLERSYRTTLRVYTGVGSRRRRRRPAAAPAAAADGKRAGTPLVERRLPGISEPTSAVALTALQSLVRSPQAKLLVLTPLILLAVFGAVLFSNAGSGPGPRATSFITLGAVGLTMLCLTQLLQNMFGFDRDGFRSYVLSPVERRRILLGKNLAVAPFALGIGLLFLLFVAVTLPVRPSHLLASLFQLLSVYLVCCFVGNFTSTIAPIALAEGATKPAHMKVSTIVKQMLFGMLFPLAMLPALIPLLLELGLHALGVAAAVPIYLLLSVVEFVIAFALYRWLLEVGGRFLMRREAKVLVEITTRTD